ncbi:MAG: hypothetical protein Q7S96_02305 [bacterium]|nr:hypothetical protein [bacterium]
MNHLRSLLITQWQQWCGDCRRMVVALRAVDFRVTARTFFRRDCGAFLVYAALIVILTPPVVGWHIRAAFYGYALLVFWVAWSYLRSPRPLGTIAMRKHEALFFRVLLIVAVLFLFTTRILPFIRYGIAPLGYDTGFYLSSLPGSIQSILAGYGHRNFRALVFLPLQWLEIPIIVSFHAVYVLVQLAIAGAIYTLAKTIHVGLKTRYTATVVFLFAVSIPQYFAFWWAYYQTEIAIALLLLMLALLHRRSWVAVLVGLLGAIIHPATFLPFSIALICFLIVRIARSLVRMLPLDGETRFLLFFGVLGTYVAQFRYADIKAFVLVYLRETVLKYGWFWTNYPATLQPQFTGLYVNRDIVHLAVVYILPFAALGVMAFFLRRLRYSRESYPLPLWFLSIFLVILLAFALTPIIYQHRWLIYLDLVLVLFAAYPFVMFIHAFLRGWLGRVVIALLLGGLMLHASLIVADQQPQLYADERAEIAAIHTLAVEPSYVMGTESQYTPWLIAFSDMNVVDPGYGNLNQWDYDMWDEFWNGASDARRHELLTMYDRPLYIFTGRTVRHGSKYMRFLKDAPQVDRVSEYFWRYDPRTVNADTIARMRIAERFLDGFVVE